MGSELARLTGGMLSRASDRAVTAVEQAALVRAAQLRQASFLGHVAMAEAESLHRLRQALGRGEPELTARLMDIEDAARVAMVTMLLRSVHFSVHD